MIKSMGLHIGQGKNRSLFLEYTLTKWLMDRIEDLKGHLTLVKLK